MSETTTVQSVNDRLMQAKLEDDAAAFADGLAAGKEWAKEHGRPKQLQRLENCTVTQNAENMWDDSDGFMIFDALFPKDADDDSAFRDFWEETVGARHDECMDREYLRGFANGAVEWWNENRV